MYDENNFIHRFYSISHIEMTYATLTSLYNAAKARPLRKTKSVGASPDAPPPLPPRPQMIDTSDQKVEKSSFVDANFANRQGKSNLLLGKK